jgi:two-component system phosphate regulon sensor histidine kinase PhoR
VAALHDLTEIERVEKTRRDFIGNVSHELRTPLTSLQGYTETLLEMPETTEAMRNFLLVIQKNAARMARLTEDLLTLARVESGEAKLELVAVEARELLQEAFQSFRDLAGLRNLELQIRESSDALVVADREAIHQVFSNLLENAMKYGKSGGNIEIGAHGETGEVEFYVRDFGPGIHSEHLPRLFERFYRVDKARSAESGGTGLGLAIVKHLVRNMGGSVRVESELNHGATFFFLLPLAETREPAQLARS